MSDVADATPSNTVISINEPESSTSSNTIVPIEPTFSEPALEPSLEGQSEGQGDDDNSNRGDHYYSEDSSGSYYSHSSGYSSSGSGYYTDDGDENKFQLLEPSSPSTHDTPTKTRQQLLLGIWKAFSAADRNYLRNTKETNLRLLQQNGISQIGHDQQEKEKELNTETQEKGDYKEQKNDNNTTNTTKNQGAAVESSDNTPVAEEHRKVHVWKSSFSSKMAGIGTENTENTETKSTSSTTSKETKESNLNLTNDETSEEMNQEDHHHHHHHHHKNHKNKHHKKKKKRLLYVDKKFENKIANNKHDRIERAKSVASTFKRKSFIKQNTIAGDKFLDNDQIDSALSRRESFRSLDRLNTISTSGDSQAKTELTEEEHISMADAIYTQQELINSAMEEGMIQRWQAHVYPYFSPNPDSQRAKYAESFVMLLVLINIVIMIIQSEQSWFHEAPRGVEILLNTIEYVSFGIFSIEYIIRLWVCTLDAKYGIYGPLQGRLWFMLSRNAIIDFVALIPSILEINACVEFQKQACRGIENCVAPDCVGNVGAGSAIRLWRIVRILKLEHYSNALTTLKGGFTKQSKLFRLILIYPSVGWVIFATLLHYTETLENGASEETMGYFSSIPRALFPVLLMLSGEMPLVDFTPAGQLIVGCLAIFSLLIMATVTGIIASGFEEAMREKQNDAHVYHRTHRAIRKLIKEEAKNHRKRTRKDRRKSFFEDAIDTPIAKEIQQNTEGLDTNGDGNIDTIVLDTNGDGRKDSIVVDTNGDGLFDSSSRL